MAGKYVSRLSLMSHETPKIINMFMSSVFCGACRFQVFYFKWTLSDSKPSKSAACYFWLLHQDHHLNSKFTGFASIHTQEEKGREWDCEWAWTRELLIIHFWLPLAIEIPDTYSTFRCEECRNILLLAFLPMNCAACNWKGRKLKRIPPFTTDNYKSNYAPTSNRCPKKTKWFSVVVVLWRLLLHRMNIVMFVIFVL